MLTIEDKITGWGNLTEDLLQEISVSIDDSPWDVRIRLKDFREAVAEMLVLYRQRIEPLAVAIENEADEYEAKVNRDNDLFSKVCKTVKSFNELFYKNQP